MSKVKDHRTKRKGQLHRVGQKWTVRTYYSRKREARWPGQAPWAVGWCAEVCEDTTAPGSPIRSFIRWHTVFKCKTEEQAAELGKQTVRALT